MGVGEGGRRRRRHEGDDNDGDEDYVLEEEEDQEEEEEDGGELSASSAGEEGGGSDAEYEVEEDCETPPPKRPVKAGDRGRKRKANTTATRSRRCRYEEDDDYLEELDGDDEFDDYQEDLEAAPRLKGATKCGGRSQKAKLSMVAERSYQRRHGEEEDMDFDPELDEDEEEEDMDFDPEVEGVDEEFEDEEEEEFGKFKVKNIGRRKPAPKQRGGKRKKNSSSKISRRTTKVRKAAPVRRRRKRSVIDHYEVDDDFIIEDQVNVNRQSRKKARFGRQMQVDYPVHVVEADTWPAVDSDMSDYEFVTSDEEHEDVEQMVVEPLRVTGRKGRRKRTFVSGSSSDSELHVADKELGDFRETEPLEAERKKRTFVSESSSDTEFHVSDKEVKNSRGIERKKRIFISESSSDSEFHVSDKKFGDARGGEPLEDKRKKKIFISESSPDYEFHVTDQELGDFREVGALEACPMLPASLKKISVTKNAEDKGKEKRELVDAGKSRCGICLSQDQRMTLQGVLNCCSHYFCFVCIMEWSRVESRCPLCKRRFTTITKSSKVDLVLEPEKSVVRVEERDQVYQPTEEEIRRWLDPYENLVCIECNQGGDDSLMLLCDICDSSAHTYCVGLGREVPEGNWYCGGCRLSGEEPSHTRSSVNSDSAELGTTAPIGTFERSPSTSRRQTFQGFDLNASPREIHGESHPAESQTSTVGVSTPSGILATLSRRRGWIRILLDRQRPAISLDMGNNGVHHSVYIPRTEANHRNLCAPSESNTSQHNGFVPRTELNHRNFETPSEANTSQAMPRYLQNSLDRPRPMIGLDVGHNGVQHSGSVPRIESNGMNFRALSEVNTSQTLVDDTGNQHNCFPLVQAQRNSSPCISVDGNNFQQTEGVKSNIKHMYCISPH